MMFTRAARLLPSCPFSTASQERDKNSLDRRTEGAVASLASVTNANGGSQVFGLSGCLDNTKVKNVVPVEGLIRVLYVYVSSCTKMLQSPWCSATWLCNLTSSVLLYLSASPFVWGWYAIIVGCFNQWELHKIAKNLLTNCVPLYFNM